MKDRIREIRKAAGLSQTKFGERLGISLSAVQKWELGLNQPDASSIKFMCQVFGVNETWLRTGAGDQKAEQSRAAEYAAMAKSLLSDKPESFRTALVTALMRFDPDGPEWAALEKIYESVEQEYRGAKKEKEP